MEDKNAFGRFATAAAGATGNPVVFVLAILTIVAWAASGPIFHFSDTWQLAINTGTTIITFLMVFIIQNSQNRDSKAIQIKLDELIRSHEGAHNALLDLENLNEHDLERIRNCYLELAKAARDAIAHGLRDTDHPDVRLGEAVAAEMAGKKLFAGHKHR
jgi:low affinity Fe/Cu permease